MLSTRKKRNQVRNVSEDESGSSAQWRWNQCGGGDQCGVHVGGIARNIERRNVEFNKFPQLTDISALGCYLQLKILQLLVIRLDLRVRISF